MSANSYNFYISGSFISHYIQTIDTNNTVDRKPIYYLVSQSNVVVNSSTNAGFVAVINSNNITVESLTLTKNSHGVVFFNTNNSRIKNVTASNNWYGTYLRSSSNNTLYNNFFNNTNNFYFYDTGYNNSWNTHLISGTNILGGSFLGGNFWTNPGGTGFSETCTDVDGDGICDTEYTLASGNVDYLPLVTTTTTTTTPTTTVTTTTIAPYALISFDPDPKDFGVYAVPVSDTQSFNIINSGDGPFIGAFSSHISGPDASYFTLLGSPYISVPANSYVTIDVLFNSSESSHYSAVFNLVGEDAPGQAASHTLDLFATITTTTNIPLNSDWNLISIPLEQNNWSITSVMASIEGNLAPSVNSPFGEFLQVSF